jgi:hypothetical protein
MKLSLVLSIYYLIVPLLSLKSFKKAKRTKEKSIELKTTQHNAFKLDYFLPEYIDDGLKKEEVTLILLVQDNNILTKITKADDPTKPFMSTPMFKIFTKSNTSTYLLLIDGFQQHVFKLADDKQIVEEKLKGVKFVINKSVLEFLTNKATDLRARDRSSDNSTTADEGK